MIYVTKKLQRFWPSYP